MRTRRSPAKRFPCGVETSKIEWQGFGRPAIEDRWTIVAPLSFCSSLRSGSLPPANFPAMNDPVLTADDVNRIVTHMNEAHTEDLIHYAQAYADVAAVEDARMTSIDADGFELAVETGSTTIPVRIDFDTPLGTVEDARSRLVELATAARDDVERERNR